MVAAVASVSAGIRPSWHRWSAMRNISLWAANQIGMYVDFQSDPCDPFGTNAGIGISLLSPVFQQKLKSTWLGNALAPPTRPTSWSHPLMCFFFVHKNSSYTCIFCHLCLHCVCVLAFACTAAVCACVSIIAPSPTAARGEADNWIIAFYFSRARLRRELIWL